MVIDLILAALATYRVGRMVAREDGPFDAFVNFRSLFTGSGWIATGIRCTYCVTFWVALLFAILLYYLKDIDALHIALVWPGLAGMAIILDKYWDRC